MLITLVVSVALAAGPKADPRLVGTWLAGGEPFITLAANGTGSMEDGKVKWSTEGSTLTITDDEGETDKVSFQVSGDVLTVSLNGMPMTLTRAGSASKKQNVQAEQPVVPQQKSARNDQLSQLLLSSAWCSFSYNKISGTTTQTRVQYFANGTWSAGGQRETYNSGPNGTVSGQTNNTNGGLWEVRNGQLWGSYGSAPLQPVQPFSVTRNSNGYPIINSLGVEYSMCN